MTSLLRAALAASLIAAPLAAAAEPLRYRTFAERGALGGPADGRAPWSQPWEYDSGGGNDNRPQLPYYQQGRGQQTGGPARNLLPDDGLRLFPY